MDDQATEVALWRYSIIVPLLAPDLSPAEARRIRADILGRKHARPGEGKAREISARTLRRWLKAYRHGGFSALGPKTRKDRGKPRNIEPRVLEKAVALREEIPERSARQIIDILTLDPETDVKGQLKRSTLSKHLARLGRTRRSLKAPKASFRRYEKDRPNALWQSDVCYGPYLPDPKEPARNRRTYLIAFMDDCSRLVTHGGFYWAEDLPSLLDCLRKAICKRGLPTRLYCDNGAIYTARQFSRITAELGIHHISARPYAPEGKGKIERFWLTVASSFLPELRKRPAQTLEELNTLWGAWVEQGYHHLVNRETGETPAARFGRSLADIRLPDPARLAEIFLWSEQRRADKTGQVTLQGNRYEVDPRLAARMVQLRYDPFDLSIIQVWHDGKRFDDARPYELVREHDQRVRPKDQDRVALPKTGLCYLDLLLSRHQDEAKAALGRIAFHRVKPDKEDETDV